MNRSLRLNIHAYYIANFLIILSSALPHAVLTVLLLAKGLSLSEIVLVQVGYSFAIIISEYPSGLIADIFSKKKVFLVSKIFLVLMFLMVVVANNFWIILLAWFMYGISSALDSGTIDVQIINDLKTAGLEHKVTNFIKYNNQLSFVALLIGSTVGSFAYYWMGISFYFIAVALTLLSIIVIWVLYVQKMDNNKASSASLMASMRISAKEGFVELGKSRPLRLMIALTFVNQFFFQTHFQLWQALFLSKSFNQHNFFIYYIVFQVLSMLAYATPIKRGRSNPHKLMFMGTITLILLLIGVLQKQNIIFIGCYTLLVFVFTFFDYISELIFSTDVSLKHISSLTSLKSTCGRVASLISLCLSSILLHFINIQDVVFINFSIGVGFTVIILGLLVTINNKTVTPAKQN